MRSFISVYVNVFWNTLRVYKQSVEWKLQRYSVWTTFIYGRRLLNVWNLSANSLYEDISVFT